MFAVSAAAGASAGQARVRTMKGCARLIRTMQSRRVLGSKSRSNLATAPLVGDAIEKIEDA
jgi:hypothetical protein